MVCVRCGTHINDDESVCYKCGYIFTNNVPEQQGGYAQGQFVDHNYQQGGYNHVQPMGYNSQQGSPYGAQQMSYSSMGYSNMPNNKMVIEQFFKEAKSMLTVSIVGVIFLFGFIGIGCSIAVWVKRSKLKVPQVITGDPMDLQLLEEAKKKYNIAYYLSFVPVVGFVLSFIIGFIIGLVSSM